MSSQQAQTGLSLPLTLIMSTATGLAVTSNYYAQPLLDTIARAFELSVNQAGLIVTAAQVGYAVGLMFLVPMGDMFERRALIVTMTLLTALRLVITALAPTLPMMLAGIGVAELCSVVAQLLVPLAATLATPRNAWQGGRHDNERPAARHSACTHHCWCTRHAGRMAHRLLGCQRTDAHHGVGPVAHAAAFAAQQ